MPRGKVGATVHAVVFVLEWRIVPRHDGLIVNS